jgi:hypothetical protein
MRVISIALVMQPLASTCIASVKSFIGSHHSPKGRQLNKAPLTVDVGCGCCLAALEEDGASLDVHLLHTGASQSWPCQYYICACRRQACRCTSAAGCDCCHSRRERATYPVRLQALEFCLRHSQ